MTFRGLFVFTLIVGLAGCAPQGAAPGPVVTVTETITAQPSAQQSLPSPTPSEQTGAALSRYVYIACTAATQHAILWAIADSVYFEERLSALASANTEWYLDVLREGTEMDSDISALSPEQARIVEEVAADFADQAIFVGQMKRTDDYYTWYETWMAVVDDPAGMDSVQALLSEAGLSDCPLYADAVIFGSDD